MAKNLDKIIKGGKLTGEEVGRLMIKDMIETFRRHQAEIKDRTGLLTHSQREALVDGLKTRADIERYGEYRGALDAIQHALTIRKMYFYAAETYGFSFHMDLTVVQNKIEALERLRLKPLVLTQDQYKALKAADRQRKLRQTITPKELILEAVEMYARRFENRQKTPFDKYFKKADPKAQEKYIKEEDHEDLYLALVAELAAMKGLDFIANLKPEDLEKSTVKIKDLYKNKILDYPEYVEAWEDAEDRTGVAIYLEEYTPDKDRLDAEGDNPREYIRQAVKSLVEAVLQRNDALGYSLDKFKEYTAGFFAYTKALELIADLVGVPDVAKVYHEPQEDPYNQSIATMAETIKNSINQIKEMVLLLQDLGYTDLTLDPRLADPPDLEELKPTKEAIKKTKTLLTLKVLKEEGIDVLNTLQSWNSQAKEPDLTKKWPQKEDPSKYATRTYIIPEKFFPEGMLDGKDK